MICIADLEAVLPIKVTKLFNVNKFKLKVDKTNKMIKRVENLKLIMTYF